MATRPRLRLAPVAEGGPVLPRSSHSSGGKANSGTYSLFRNLGMVALLVATVYYFSTITHHLGTDVPSTGKGEGIEDIMDHWSRHDVDIEHDRHEFRTARERGTDNHHHTAAAADAHAAEVDDGSIVINTATNAAADAHAALPPAHSVGAGPNHSGSGAAATDKKPHYSDVIPDPASEPAAAAQPQHPAHAAKVDAHPAASGLYALTAIDIDGRERQLSEFAGKVTLVVNVASKCGFTDINYRGLQEAYAKYQPHGLEILAFPCNQFGAQEPGTAAEIKQFAEETYHTTFPLFSKVDVNGPSTHPVFEFLKRQLPVDQGGGGGSGPGKDLGWNFQKFIVDRQGQPVKLLHQDWHQGQVEHEIYSLLT